MQFNTDKTFLFKIAFLCTFFTLCFSRNFDQHDGQLTNMSFSEMSEEGNITTSGLSGNETSDPHGEEHVVKRFQLIHMDFERIHNPIIIGLWIFCACLGKIVFHMSPRLSNIFPESCMLILLGLLIGGIFYYASPGGTDKSPLTANVFFIYMLPPIILDAGYFMPNRLFFDHLGTILFLAVAGTIWNTLTIGISLYALTLTGLFGGTEPFPVLHIFLFSSLVSAVDPVAVLSVFEEIHVEEVLFILVFGESLLNDGVTVVLYHMFEGFSDIGEDNLMPIDILNGFISFFLVAFGGTIIGVLWGFLAAFVTRFTHQVRVIEPIFIFVMSYLAYLHAELFHWSGILAITFCGITMKNYTEQNMSSKSQTTTKYAMKMLASSSETVIFLFLGVATVHGTQHDFNLWFVLFTILFISVYRSIGVLIMSAVCNRFRVQKIDFVQKFVMSYGGLRGAVAFALAITINPTVIPLAPMFVTTTIAVVFFTVFVQGITIKPLVEKLGVKKSQKRKLNMNERLHGRSMDYIMAGIEDITGKFGNHYIRGWFKGFNNKYLQPNLVRNPKAKEPKLFETLSHLKMQDAMTYMNKKPTSIADLESLSQVLQNNMYSRNSIREWNLDVGELEYKPGDRDINDAKFHHILSDSYQPIKGRRQSCYKRHAVRDDELETPSDFQNKMYMQARQVVMTSIRNRKPLKKSAMEEKFLQVRRATLENGSAIRLKNDYLEETARDNPAYIDDEQIFSKPESDPASNLNLRRMSKKGPVMAELVFPWKRFTQDDVPASNTKYKRSTSIVDGNQELSDVAPTMAEMLLPWKRNEDDETFDNPLKQTDFPYWGENTVQCYSPSNTILGKLTNEQRPTMKEIFERRQSAHNLNNLRRGSLKVEDMPSLRNSAKDDIYARRGSLRDDPSYRRSSLKDMKEIPQARSHLHPLDNQSKTDTHPDRRSSRDSLGFDSLINTVIMEDDEKDSRASIKSKSNVDHVITMNPGGSQTP